MTREEQNLLIKDLCARIPYGVILNCAGKHAIEELKMIDENGLINNDWDINEVRPYLRPLSSMTEEERKSLPFPWTFDGTHITSYTEENGFIEIQESDVIKLIDQLLKGHFDFHGLIPKDLAISTETFNPYIYMTDRDRKLLLVDLCSRLPYSPKVQYNDEVYDAIGYAHGKVEICKLFSSKTEWVDLEEVKLILRPFKLTEDQWEYIKYRDDISKLDYFNTENLDYRGLISAGLAIKGYDKR